MARYGPLCKNPDPQLTPDCELQALIERNQLLYLMYGDRHEYLVEAKFSILTALNRRVEPGSFFIAVMTDQPDLFQGWPVQIHPLDEAKLASWMGQGDYVHRRKACAIREGLKYAHKTIFVDTDTVFLKDPALLFERVSEGRYLMDQLEFKWAEAARRREYAGLCEQLKNEGALPSSDLRLFNSGICGMTSGDVALMDEAISRIDQWAHHHRQLHTMEQIAVSFVLDGKHVSEAKDCVEHYFSKKPFFHAMHQLFFTQHGLEFHDGLPALSAEVPAALPDVSVVTKLKIKWRLMRLNRDLKRAGHYYLLGKQASTCCYEEMCRQVWLSKAQKDLNKREAQRLALLKM